MRLRLSNGLFAVCIVIVIAVAASIKPNTVVADPSLPPILRPLYGGYATCAPHRSPLGTGQKTFTTHSNFDSATLRTQTGITEVDSCEEWIVLGPTSSPTPTPRPTPSPTPLPDPKKYGSGPTPTPTPGPGPPATATPRADPVRYVKITANIRNVNYAEDLPIKKLFVLCREYDVFTPASTTTYLNIARAGGGPLLLDTDDPKLTLRPTRVDIEVYESAKYTFVLPAIPATHLDDLDAIPATAHLLAKPSPYPVPLPHAWSLECYLYPYTGSDWHLGAQYNFPNPQSNEAFQAIGDQ